MNVADVNPGSAVARDQCLTIAVSPAAAFACGDLRLAHALPSLTTRGVTRTPTLVYNSEHALPIVLVRANVALRADVAQTAPVTVTLHVAGTQRDSRVYQPAGWDSTQGGSPSGRARRVTLGFNASDLPTGLYAYTVTVNYGGGVSVSASDFVAVVNRVGSPFGAGWWLAGYERLYAAGAPLQGGAEPPPVVFWVGGDGSSRLYTRARLNTARDTALYRALSLTHPDTLTWYRAGSTAGTNEWARHLPGGAAVRFTGDGLHWHTVDRLGQSTWFDHTGNYDHPSLIRPPASNVGYALDYATVNGTRRLKRVGQVRALGGTPLQTGQPLDTLRFVRLVNASGAVTEIRGPEVRGTDTTRVRFGHGSGGAANLVTSRTDRRGTAQYFGYDPISNRLERATSYADTQTVAHRFCAVEGHGLSACTSVPAEVNFLATSWNGPRTDVADVTYFATNRWGMVTRVQDALEHAMTVERGDNNFPGLPTRTTDFGGLVTQAFYDPINGLPDSVRTINPYGPKTNGQDSVATTKYAWLARWRAPTQITSPEQVVTSFGYDDNNGNRLWQQLGPDAARRVNFTYKPAGGAVDAGLVASVLQPNGVGGQAPQVVRYDALGNVDSVAGPGNALTKYRRDEFGRVIQVRTRIAGETYRVDSTHYDVIDRVTREVGIGPRVAGTDSQIVAVQRWYTAEGQDSVVTRQSVLPATLNGAIRTEWRYDALGRRVAEIAPDSTQGTLADNPVDSTYFDRAGNADSVRTRRGHVIRMTYDVLNRLQTRTLPAVTYARRRQGLPTLRQPAGEPAYPRYENGPDSANALRINAETHQFTYDANGRLLTANGPDAEVTRAYHPNGLLRSENLRVRTTDGAAVDATHAYLTGYAYDLDGRRTRVTYPAQLSPGGTAADGRMTYESATGLLSTVRDVQGNEYRYGYNSRGEVDSLLRPGPIVERWAYEADGTPKGDTLSNRAPSSQYPHPYPVLRATVFEYDARAQLRSMGNGAGLRDTLRSSYDGLGQVATTSFSAAALGVLGAVNFTSSDALAHDALGNLRSNTTTTQGRTRDYFQSSSATQTYRYEPRTGRLLGMSPNGAGGRTDTLFHDRAGNVEFKANNALGSAGLENRASYYAADNTPRVADHRVTDNQSLPIGTQPYRSTFEEYRYDALGRRVWVRTRRECRSQVDAAGRPPAAVTEGECNLSTVRRTVWDGDQELGEIQMPGQTNAPAAQMENDAGALPEIAPTTSDSAFDANRFFGRVAYAYGLGVDEPLGVTRLGYVDAAGPRVAHVFAPFTLAPLWNHRGQAENGAFHDGGQRRCEASGGTRCILVQFPEGWYPYNKPMYVPLAWHGTLIEEKRDKAGTLYRRNRAYDPATGRFTQEDPIGLAGGVNLYGYAGSDPVNLSDPFGLCPPIQSCLALAGGAAIADGPLPFGDVIGAGILVTGGTLILLDALHKEQAGPGSTGGPTAGRPATQAERRAARARNREANDGELRCVYCGIETTEEPGRPNSSEVDHTQPRNPRDGGPRGNNTPDNLKNTCRTCNRQKSNQRPPFTPTPRQ